MLETADAVRVGLTSASHVARDVMTGIVNRESGPDRLNAFTSFDYEAALSQAQRVDADRVAGRTHALPGVCVGVKDNICTLGLPTTCGSRMLADYRSPYEATVVKRLREAGVIIAGKTNLDEFAMGSSTEHSAFGPTLNPHDRTRVAGGSSGGSAAAVAAGLVHAALGSDTGGSVRQPAAFCGVVGMKPTWGAVSRYGLTAFASSLDTVGVLARGVSDAAALFRVIHGPDERDATTHAPRPRHAPEVRVVGVPRSMLDHADAAMRHAFEHVLDVMRSNGIEVRDVDLPHVRFALPAYIISAAAEASTNLARYDGVRFGSRAQGSSTWSDSRAALGTEVRRRILLGTFATSSAQREHNYARALAARSMITREMTEILAVVDVLFTPTTPGCAFASGERLTAPARMYDADVFTIPPSLAGLPALSLPIGTDGGLPLGGQLVAPHYAEERLFAFGTSIEAWLRA